MCGCRACSCRGGGLVARGSFLLSAGPEAAAGGGDFSNDDVSGGDVSGAARDLRLNQLLLNDPPVVAFARLEERGDEYGNGGGGPAGVAAALRAGGLRGRWSGLAGGAPLAPNVHLVTLMRAEEGDGSRAVVRLAHQFQVGEDAALSRPARVDLSALLPRPLASITELSLTAARRRADMPPRAKWDVGGGAAAAPARGRGGGGEAAGSGRGEWGWGSGSQEAYDVWNHESDEMPVVELYPMEIRTFELRFAD
ncbi:hypothetical protein MNEG_8554 [Monoraphidium neglectum]|uniref:Uncharacterized protein n=1 Tax=Monoraphidium neglectum TaxID=145388 RepID=A0A0D2MFA4_9CHLO|nr:hypothetical protein MNEG_8554 [Monoraphidium neglectum]KIY99411.1 hypothetical protein MNEG_8554 [Monoraphidium neglectum]|eukprot:XP_013898431.1 hypothetical protein MNEG_8554 [Monoraphidium neglectum]